MKTSTRDSQQKQLLASIYLKLTALILFLPIFSFGQVFYGMTSSGGANSDGTIFHFNPGNVTETVDWSFSFSFTDGESPYGTPVYYPAGGVFYAMTYGGGANSFSGTIVSLNPRNDKENLSWSFGAYPDGYKPYGDLVYNPTKQLFYGLTEEGDSNGEGAIISFDPVKDTEYVLWNFGDNSDGTFPYGDLVWDAIYNVYFGTTSGGGVNAFGTIFSFNPQTNVEQVVYSFGNYTGDGENPYGSLVLGPNSLYYGTTYYGGANGEGALFSFNPKNNSVDTVWSFGSGSDGVYPYGNLVLDASQNYFYGTTNEGGSGSSGVIYQFIPSRGKEKVVWNFGVVSGDGVNPYYQTPVWDSANGLFYGMTNAGGSNSVGVIYSFDPVKDTEIVVWNFGGLNDGAFPEGNLTYFDTNQLYLGNKQLSINNGQWVIFPNPTSGQFTMQSSDVSLPYGSQGGQLSVGNTIEVYNEMGQQVLSQHLVTNTQYSIDLSSQPAGVYLVRLITSKGEFFTGRVVKE